jgi:hypothetical protein
MEKNQNFVGAVRVKPVAQEMMKTCAGGMIAVSSAILLFWMQSDKEITSNILVMLCAHAFAIPLLAAARIYYGILDGFERVSVKADDHALNLAATGVAFAFTGYFFQILFLNKVLALFFALGLVLAWYWVWRFNKHLDDPHMIRR